MIGILPLLILSMALPLQAMSDFWNEWVRENKRKAAIKEEIERLDLFSYIKDPLKVDFLRHELAVNKENPNRELAYKGTLLQIATEYQNGGAMQLLLEFGADINKVTGSNFKTPLIIAMEKLRKKEIASKEYTMGRELMILLLQKGAGLEAWGGNWCTPLMWAISECVSSNDDVINKRSIIKLLLFYGANPYLGIHQLHFCDTFHYPNEGVFENAITLAQKREEMGIAYENGLVEYIDQTQQRLIAILTKILSGTVTDKKIKIPHDVARLIASYCYPHAEKLEEQHVFFWEKK
jgi:hypothetical protein